MAYRCFTDLREKFSGDLVAKANNDIESLDFIDCPCNCSWHCFVNGACVYKGGTQDHLMARMRQEDLAND
eukprot:1024260-Ditylum_brightwellii.AAC.1